ncbi:MAG: sigma-54-dependent Fis family transcriptional regulator [Verrucomicrobia bacterium]|nr:sigma-54-dependent Fis family transcriptional regulator [Verrucomicrobiota bacterium]
MNPSTRFSCLLLDDDTGFSGMLARLVAEEGGDPVTCSSVHDARQALTKRTFDLAVLDNRLGDGTGFEFYPHLRRRCPEAVVLMITGAPELAQAVELTRNGLFDYLTKPLAASDFIACLRRAKLRLSRPETASATDLVGSSPAMQEILNTLRQAAKYPEAPVLMLGETGTGKDLAARLLHQMTYGARASTAPYIALNCSAVPGEMFEAELFGSEKGAYTGADRRRTGLIEAADGGTLFLDEVGEIPLPQQAKLLRFLENREYRPLGSTVSRTFAGRIMAATNRTLAEEVRAGRLREDLMFRLDVLSVRLPPLRERLSDLNGLAETLLGQLAQKYGRRKPILRSSDLQALQHHHFPGNVRELRNLLERSLLRTPAESDWLNMDLGWLTPTPASVSLPTTLPSPPFPSPVAAPIPAAIPPAQPGSSFLPPPGRELSPLEAPEYQLIAQALREEGGGIRRAAARLGLTHQALLRRLQKWPELRQAAGEG